MVPVHISYTRALTSQNFFAGGKMRGHMPSLQTALPVGQGQRGETAGAEAMSWGAERERERQTERGRGRGSGAQGKSG
jgi:hypothetical protein